MANKIVPQTLNSSGVYDKLITAISSGGAGAESESAAVKNLISGLTSTSPASDDLIPFQDVSSGNAGKTTLSALASTLQSVRGYAKIQTGSYVGTGTYGESNPCSLMFNFIPQLLFIFYNIGSSYKKIITVQEYNHGATYELICFLGNMGNYKIMTDSDKNNPKSTTDVSFVNTSVFWYNDSSQTSQWNSYNTNYFYFCLG